MDLKSLVQMIPVLIPLIVPILLAVVKAFVPKIPKVALPILTPIVGAGLDILSYYLGLPNWGPVSGVVLGALGVFVREVYDQLKKAIVSS